MPLEMKSVRLIYVEHESITPGRSLCAIQAQALLYVRKLRRSSQMRLAALQMAHRLYTLPRWLSSSNRLGAHFLLLPLF